MPDIPLVRTDGKVFSAGITLSPERFVHAELLSRASKSDHARETEKVYGLGDSLYFFAGYACPGFGDVVFIFEASCLDGVDGGATPFDTGGLYGRKIFARAWDGLDRAAEDEARRELVAQSQRSLSDWRSALDEYLSEFFDTPREYLRGDRPRKDDASGRLGDARNSRRAWTWEVRAHADLPIGQGLRRIWASADYEEAIRQQVLTMNDDKRKSWNERVGKRLVRVAPGESPHARAEAELTS
ncbi:MAG TPA: hypothetical protein VFA20_29415 [Myxococcaceae bacterium]|nr:hypothetical protein [Myxococcaceae bacterium]